MKYVRGVYRLKKRKGDAKSPVVYFDGESFWIPGWECSLEPSDGDGSFTIDEDNIGELIWEDNDP